MLFYQHFTNIITLEYGEGHALSLDMAVIILQAVTNEE